LPFSCKWGEFMNVKKIKMLFLCFGLTLLLMSVGYSLFEESFSISSEVTLGSTGDDGKIEYELEVQLSKWQAGKYEYQYNPFTMTYIGEEVTKSWHMIIDVPDDATLSACWNVTCKLENGILNLNPTSQTLRLGSKQSAVIYLQQLLTSFLYDVGTIDGIFGSNTDRAVREFQRENGLTEDGIVGRNTWNALISSTGRSNPN